MLRKNVLPGDLTSKSMQRNAKYDKLFWSILVHFEFCILAEGKFVKNDLNFRALLLPLRRNYCTLLVIYIGKMCDIDRN